MVDHEDPDVREFGGVGGGAVFPVGLLGFLDDCYEDGDNAVGEDYGPLCLEPLSGCLRGRR